MVRVVIRSDSNRPHLGILPAVFLPTLDAREQQETSKERPSTVASCREGDAPAELFTETRWDPS